MKKGADSIEAPTPAPAPLPPTPPTPPLPPDDATAADDDAMESFLFVSLLLTLLLSLAGRWLGEKPTGKGKGETLIVLTLALTLTLILILIRGKP